MWLSFLAQRLSLVSNTLLKIYSFLQHPIKYVSVGEGRRRKDRKMQDFFQNTPFSKDTKAMLEKKTGCTPERIRSLLYTEVCFLCFQIWALKTGKY